MPTPHLPLLVFWEGVALDLLERTAKMPKSVRFTFCTRIDNLALDVLERLAEAQYAALDRRRKLVRRVDARLARLRALLRLAERRALLSHGAYEHVMRGVDEAGRMLGGWRAYLERAAT